MVKPFTEDVLNQEGKILVKFGAQWCGPCRQLGPVIANMAEKGLTVYEVDIDKDQDSTIKYGIRSVPTTHIFENGEIVATVVGVKPQQELEELLK